LLIEISLETLREVVRPVGKQVSPRLARAAAVGIAFPEGPSAIADFHDLLIKTSRTFALAIPVLGDPLRHQVGLAYLLFRIADTFEDAHTWAPSRRAACLEEFAELVETGGRGAEAAAMRWLEGNPTEHAGYRELLTASPAVLEAFAALAPPARAAIAVHVARTCRGMAGYVGVADSRGRLELATLADLRGYCYVVAGIVGELLTELFVLAEPRLNACQGDLSQRAAEFGEALQLVNILKDSTADAAEGRRFLPAGVERREVFGLARRDLVRAAEYVVRLQEAGSERGIVVFTALPLLLARETLDRVEAAGAGAKLSRDRVAEIAAGLAGRLDAGLPAV
jgi:farnesyl-diphosphate farnesyltransferase